MNQAYFPEFLNALIPCALLILCYALGSIPFGLVLTRLAGLGDIRKIGSGNIGATNVLRTGNKKLAALTVLLDAGKGAFAVLLTQELAPSVALWAGIAALLGHMFPFWLKFKGGKGVATAIGIILVEAWPVALALMGVWLLMVLISRYSSLSALVACLMAPFFTLWMGPHELTPAITAIALLVIAKHGGNIRRLISGTETKIGKP